MGFGSSSLFPARKREAVTQGETRGINHLTQRRTQGAIIVKGTISLGVWEKRKDRKTRKSKSEEKVVGFNAASLPPARK